MNIIFLSPNEGITEYLNFKYFSGDYIMDKEIFKPCYGYEKTYKISNKSTLIKLINKKTGKRNIEIKSSLTNTGFLTVNLYQDGKGKCHSLHKLTLLTFKGGTENKRQIVKHEDLDYLNGDIENLYWGHYNSESGINTLYFKGKNIYSVDNLKNFLSYVDIRGTNNCWI